MAMNGIGGARSPFHALGVAASGLSAQRARIETIVENIANAETTRTPDGGPYRRKVARLVTNGFAAELATEASPTDGGVGVRAPRAPRPPVDPSGTTETATVAGGDPADAGGAVRVATIETDPTPGPRIYDPGHPDADADGFVEMPNVSITEEMIGLMESRRLYEANATVFDAVKQMLSRAARL